MVKHKLPDLIRERFLLHRKQNLIYHPLVCSQIYHATYRNFSLVIKRELIKLAGKIGWLHARSSKFRLKLASLMVVSMLLLPQSIAASAQSPAIANQPISANIDSKWDNPIEISQVVSAEAYVAKKTADVTTTKNSAKPAPVTQTAFSQSEISTAGNIWPVRGSMTTRFSAFHKGIDIIQAGGAPIHPLSNGNVTWTGWSVGWGNNVMIDHGNGLTARYAHMSKINSKAGDQVDPSSTLGLIGATGWATGNHLHLEVYKNNVAIDPVRVLP